MIDDYNSINNNAAKNEASVRNSNDERDSQHQIYFLIAAVLAIATLFGAGMILTGVIAATSSLYTLAIGVSAMAGIGAAATGILGAKYAMSAAREENKAKQRAGSMNDKNLDSSAEYNSNKNERAVSENIDKNIKLALNDILEESISDEDARKQALGDLMKYIHDDAIMASIKSRVKNGETYKIAIRSSCAEKLDSVSLNNGIKRTSIVESRRLAQQVKNAAIKNELEQMRAQKIQDAYLLGGARAPSELPISLNLADARSSKLKEN